MAAKLRNNISTTLQASIASGDLTLTVPSGQGAKWDDCAAPDYAYTTIMDTAGTVVEVVKVTARSGDTLTIERAMDGTTAQGWAAGSIVERRLNALSIFESVRDWIQGVAVSFAAKISFLNTVKLQQVLEKITITGSAPGATPTFDVLTQAIQYYTTNAAANFTLNVRGDGSNTLNSIMATGESITITLMVTCGATAYYETALQIDGNAVTPKWIGGAPTNGFASAIAVYTHTIIKTGSAAFTVISSVSKAA